MDKLVEYSDDEDEVAAVEARDLEDVTKQKQSAETGREDEENENRGKVELSQVSEEKSISRQLGPPAKRILSRRSEQPESSSSGSNRHNAATETRYDIDPEWGLGLEKSSDDIDKELYKKLTHFQTLKKEQGTHFNQSLNRNRSFHNPHIYNKLVQWVDVEETGSGYGDMIKGGKAKADSIWPSSTEARQKLMLQGGKDVISSLQRKRQEESDERKKKARRDNLDFVGAAKASSPAPSTNSRSQSEALALAESRARKIRDELVAKRRTGDDEGDRHRRKDRERDRSHQQHHHSRRP